MRVLSEERSPLTRRYGDVGSVITVAAGQAEEGGLGCADQQTHEAN